MTENAAVFLSLLCLFLHVSQTGFPCLLVNLLHSLPLWQPILSLSSQQTIHHYAKKNLGLSVLFALVSSFFHTLPGLFPLIYQLGGRTCWKWSLSLQMKAGRLSRSQPATACHIPEQFARQHNNQLQHWPRKSASKEWQIFSNYLPKLLCNLITISSPLFYHSAKKNRAVWQAKNEERKGEIMKGDKM